ncbi:hypothetical protein [Halorussus pelagicus]|uniref:hypothetical protein n=1 Tax=Halorussus pelagicus TaxID=2505977 RepID=UPI001AA060CE|nr:hypothetical protein [Halorussus pelagicus]
MRSPLDGFASVALAGLFAVIVTATAVGLWRRMTDSDGATYLGTAEDITYDPFADPGQAVRRPPGDDEHDD